MLVGVSVGALAVCIAIWCAGGGHGTYIPAALLFPYTMAIAAPLGIIVWPLLGLAIVQFPGYGFLVGSKGRRFAGKLVVVHILCALVACALIMATDSFR